MQLQHLIINYKLKISDKMKSTNHFKNTIQAYLEERAASDPQFEWAYTTKENKNIDDCVLWIAIHKQHYA